MADATAVVAVMSVQPTSEKRTVLQLSGSAAAAVPADSATAIAANAHPFIKSCIDVSLRSNFSGRPRPPATLPDVIETSMPGPCKPILIDRSIKNR